MVFDHGGQVVANAYEQHEQIYPNPGWVEHDPIEIWENTQQVVLDGLADAGLEANQLDAIGITNQRETTIVWDRETGRPVHNALVWQDRRTTDRVEELQEADKVEDIREKTGLEADAYFSATKTEWILDNAEPLKMQSSRGGDLRDRAREGELVMGTIDSWLIYNLTGNHITDVTNASRTMLYNIRDLEWDDELLEEFDVPEGDGARGTTLLRRGLLRTHRRGRLPRRGGPRRRGARRPAGRPVRADLLRRRRREEHLRHRLLLPDEHGQRGRQVRPRTADDHRVPDVRRARPVRAGGRSSSPAPRSSGSKTSI